MPAAIAEMSSRSMGRISNGAEVIDTDQKVRWRSRVTITEHIGGKDRSHVVRAPLLRRSVGDLLRLSERPDRLVSIEVGKSNTLRVLPNATIEDGTATIPQVGAEPLVRDARLNDKVAFVPIDVYLAKDVVKKGSIYEE